MATKKGQEIANILGEKSDTMPAHMQQDAGMGNEQASGALATPYLKLLQNNSPELREVEGAREGLLYDTVSKELHEFIYVVPLYMEHYFTVWKDQNKGGGKFGEFPSEADALSHIATLPGSDDPELYVAQETHKHYFLILDAESGEVVSPAVIYMKNTQLGPSRAMNTQIHQSKAPRFAKVWKISSTIDTNRAGKAYANFLIEDTDFWTPEGIYEEAKALCQGFMGEAA